MSLRTVRLLFPWHDTGLTSGPAPSPEVSRVPPPADPSACAPKRDGSAILSQPVGAPSPRATARPGRALGPVATPSGRATSSDQQQTGVEPEKAEGTSRHALEAVEANPGASRRPERLRDVSAREPRSVPTHDLALFRGAVLEIANQAGEIERLRALCFANGIDPEARA